MDSNSDQRILLIEGESTHAATIRAALAEKGPACVVEWVQKLSVGAERLSQGHVDAVLLDLFLPDCQGLATFEQLFQAAPHVPIVIVCEPSDESVAMRAVTCGADDYLFTTHLDSFSLRHAVRNAVARHAAAEALFAEQARAQVTLNAIGDAVLCADLAGRVTYLNLVAEELTGWTRQDAIGRPLGDLFQIIDGATREPLGNPLAAIARDHATAALGPNCIFVRRGGREATIEGSVNPIHDRRGLVIGAAIVVHDVTAARAMSLQMSHAAHHDPLTDLPNRLLLNDRLTREIESARRHRRQLALLSLGLDRFKQINDSLGHDVGDQLLRSVAEQLRTCVRSTDTVSRQGGDEFVVVLSEIEQASNAIIVAEKMIAALGRPHRVAGHELHSMGSIGISVYPDDGHDAKTLLKNADLAMYHAKERGRGCYQFFQPAMNALVVERALLEQGLRRALDRQEFILHYQPKMDLASGAMVGAEALIRWQHPERGLLPPGQFVSIAEESGLIVPIGQWVLHEACRQARAWQDSGLKPIPIAVNVSAVEFRRANFLGGVRQVLDETRLEPRYIELEMTESVLMARGDSSVPLLRELKALGVQLTLDDFGTGYSSLSYLKEFPIDALKIDQSFVQEMTGDLNGAPIVSAIISMGKGLNQRVIAEGIETAEQLAFLRAQHCSEGQGYYFSPPLPAEQFAMLLAPDRSQLCAHDRP